MFVTFQSFKPVRSILASRFANVEASPSGVNCKAMLEPGVYLELPHSRQVVVLALCESLASKREVVIPASAGSFSHLELPHVDVDAITEDGEW